MIKLISLSNILIFLQKRKVSIVLLACIQFVLFAHSFPWLANFLISKFSNKNYLGDYSTGLDFGELVILLLGGFYTLYCDYELLKRIGKAIFLNQVVLLAVDFLMVPISVMFIILYNNSSGTIEKINVLFNPVFIGVLMYGRNLAVDYFCKKQLKQNDRAV